MVDSICGRSGGIGGGGGGGRASPMSHTTRTSSTSPSASKRKSRAAVCRSSTTAEWRVTLTSRATSGGLTECTQAVLGMHHAREVKHDAQSWEPAVQVDSDHPRLQCCRAATLWGAMTKCALPPREQRLGSTRNPGGGDGGGLGGEGGGGSGKPRVRTQLILGSSIIAGVTTAEKPMALLHDWSLYMPRQCFSGSRDTTADDEVPSRLL